MFFLFLDRLRKVSRKDEKQLLKVTMKLIDFEGGKITFKNDEKSHNKFPNSLIVIPMCTFTKTDGMDIPTPIGKHCYT